MLSVSIDEIGSRISLCEKVFFEALKQREQKQNLVRTKKNVQGNKKLNLANAIFCVQSFTRNNLLISS